jgi:hypothetical protein
LDQEVDPDTYSFERVDGATMHTVALDDTDDTPAWNVLILDPPAPEPVDDQDGGTPTTPGPTITFSLPEMSPDPLPLGNMEMTVTAMEILGFDALDFEIKAIEEDDRIRRQSTDVDGFSRD